MSSTTAIVLSAGAGDHRPAVVGERGDLAGSVVGTGSGWASVPAITMIGAASRATAPARVRFDTGSPLLDLDGARAAAVRRGRAAVGWVRGGVSR